MDMTEGTSKDKEPINFTERRAAKGHTPVDNAIDRAADDMARSPGPVYLKMILQGL